MEYGLIGKTLGYSFSKLIHQALADYDYQLCPLPTEEAFTQFMEEKNFRGINVTIPYKQAVIPYCHQLDPKAEAIGAVNTILQKEGKLYGYNTDFDGFCYLAQEAGISFQGKSLLILGTGGTYKTVEAVAKSQGVKEIFVASRKPQENQVSYQEALELQGIQVIVNTSPLGMYPENQDLALPLEGFAHLTGVLDVVYNPLCSALVQEAKRLGIPASGGLAMLVAQAKYAAQIFTNQEIPQTATKEVLGEIARDQSNLVLIGMPSCGKSVLGKWCAQDMGRKFIDLDKEIEKQAKMPISALFAQEGEEHFRQLETKVCQQFAKEHGLVISTGGGIVTRAENLQALEQNAVIVYVERPLENLLTGGNRPLSSSKEAVAELFRQREPLYQRACHYLVKNNDLIKVVAQKIQEVYHENFSAERS